jgi:2-(1,2-epoxy-1,2-dihydrophenyl)acetyl-CoA isomerase
MSFILKEVKNQVGYITFNRPDKFNSFNKEMSMDFQAALDECAADETVRAIYITAVGKAFCAGQDLGEAVDPQGPELQAIVRDHYNPIIERIRNIQKPVVCAVNGVAAGAGANIALCADVVIAVEHATFIQAFSKIGLIPDCGGTFFLPRLIGFQKASALMMMADNIDAKEAERLGMIYKYFPADTFEAEAQKIVQYLAQMPTQAFAYTKMALNQSFQNSLTQQLSLEEAYQTTCGKTADFEEGVAAFLAKRKPEFSGK